MSFLCAQLSFSNKPQRPNTARPIGLNDMVRFPMKIESVFPKYLSLNSFYSHFSYESFASVLDAVRKMRGEVHVHASVRDVFEALSDKKATVDLHRFR